MGCEVEQCCCGCSLKTGSMVIGIVEAVLCGISLIMAIIASSAISILRDSPWEENINATKEEIEDFQSAMSALAILLIVVAVILAVQVVFAILLACGAGYEKPSLIKSWIIYSIVYFVVTVIMYIVIASIAFGNNQSGSGAQSLVSCILGSALKIYYIIVVRSYHLQLTRQGAGRSIS
ncbi:uncharacterized protein [Anabrus simplex]|uniref:uncharacterized protein n=1 Tax=Anabrus simplex TaxID=316456 RepID=UPI0035A3A59F